MTAADLLWTVFEYYEEDPIVAEVLDFGLEKLGEKAFAIWRYRDGPVHKSGLSALEHAEVEFISWLASEQFKREYEELRPKILKAREYSPEGFAAMLEVCFTDPEGRRWRLAQFQREWCELLFEHQYLVLFAPTETSKTTLVTIGWSLYRLGHNPNLRIALVSNSNEQAQKFSETIGQHIVANWWYRVIFPHIRPAENALRSDLARLSRRQITVERTAIMKDYSIAAYGVGGALLNARLDMVILDDIVDLESATSPKLRDYYNRWVDATVLSRLVDSGQLIAVGTAWHKQDVYHYLESKPIFTAVRYSLVDTDERDGYRIIKWDKYPPERLEKEYQKLGPLEFARTKRCRPYTDEDKLFPKDLITRHTYPLSTEIPEHWPRYMGVDISTSARAGSAMVVIAVDPESKIRYVLDAQYGSWGGPKFKEMLLNMYHAWLPQRVVVENNSMQAMLVDFLSDDLPDVPILAFTTGKNKADPLTGLPSLSVEFHNGLWRVPELKHGLTCKCGLCTLIEQLSDYPTGSTDLVMALWFAREGYRLTSGKYRKRKRALRGSSKDYKIIWI